MSGNDTRRLREWASLTGEQLPEEYGVGRSALDNG